MPKFSNKEKAQECRRELGQRNHVYPRRVSERKMTQQQADRQVALIEDMARDYEALDAQDRPDLFAEPSPTPACGWSGDTLDRQLQHALAIVEGCHDYIGAQHQLPLERIADRLRPIAYGTAPHPGVKEKMPVVCYFDNDTDRTEFIAAVLSVKPRMRCEKV